MSVQIHQAGQSDEAGAVKHLRVCVLPCALTGNRNIDDQIALDDDVDGIATQRPNARQYEATHAAPSVEPPSIRYRTAMRTETPLVT